ncbi:hypothetical protein Hanom_Chr13g01192831 [Helianthus anomalus]
MLQETLSYELSSKNREEKVVPRKRIQDSINEIRIQERIHECQKSLNAQKEQINSKNQHKYKEDRLTRLAKPPSTSKPKNFFTRSEALARGRAHQAWVVPSQDSLQ